MIEEFHEEKCKACVGTGIQVNSKTGLTQYCPECGGTGRKRVSNLANLGDGEFVS